MRILLSGGIKTQNIVSGIQKKFVASGDEFIVVEYIDDVDELFGRGEFFDKVLVTEQSITKDYSISDEYTIRHRINDFANMMSSKPRKFNYVFLSQTEEMANMIHEEILPILKESAVVLKEPPYTVPFFVSILVTDSKQLPEEIIYTPSLTITETETVEEHTEIFDDMDSLNTGANNKLAPENFDTELFGVKDGFEDLTDEFKVTDELDITGGEEDDLGIPVGDLEALDDSDIEEELGINLDEALEEYDDEPEAEVYQPDSTPKFNENWGDQSLNMEGINPVKKSGELNNYVEAAEQLPQNTGYIPGFDEPEEENTNDMYEDTPYVNTMDESVYQTEFEQSMYTDDPGQINYDEVQGQEQYDSNQFNGGFGEYSEDNVLPGFDTSDYANEEEEEEEEPVQTEQAGFDMSDYVQPQIIEEPQQQLPPVDINNNTGKKKGLLSKIKGDATPQQQLQQNNMNVQQNSGMMNSVMGLGKLTPEMVAKELKPFAARGNSIVVTGCGGCGTSTVAYSLASIVSQLGYTVLLVDFDTEGRTQSYISKENYDSMEPDGANLMSAVNSSNGINTHISIVRSGFHLLTMGLGTDTAPVNELIHKEKISRFVNLAKTSHNFVIYDIPFNTATGFLSDITYMCDNLVLVTDASNWGITKTMLAVCNIGSDDMQDTIFNRAQFVFNRYRNLFKVLGKKVRTCVDITKVMDQKVLDLVGDDPGFHFEDLHIAGIINDDPDFENGWFEQVQYADTKKGQQIFLELIEHIVLKK